VSYRCDSMRPGLALFLAMLAVLLLFVPVVVRGQGGTPVFQTGLATEKSSYKLGETVHVLLILYNPTSQRIAVHFSGGCWFSFIVRDSSGMLVYNQTMPACDPTINGLENVTDVMTVDAGGGRWFGMSWDQLDPSGRHVPVPGDYVLSWSFKSPDQSIPEASNGITLTSQVESPLDAFWPTLLRFFELFAPYLWIGFVATTIPWSKAMKDVKRASRLKLAMPAVISTIATFAILFAFYSSQLVCLAIQCPGTISLLNSLNLYLFVTPIIWAAIFLVGREVSQKRIWIPLVAFESSTAVAVVLAFSILQAMEQLARDTFYYNWTIVAPSLALYIATVPASWLFYRTFKGKLLASGIYTPKPPKPQTFFDLPRC